MKPLVANVEQETVLQKREKIYFSEGLLAFENIREFELLANPDEAPFLWLQDVNNSKLAFITIDPFLVFPRYRPDIPAEDLEVLKIRSPGDVFITCIVNIKHAKTQGVTANLVSPVVINWKEGIGKQIILANYHHYLVKFKIS